MARRYARDNRGRFSSTGATARGGRLATASGKRRATQTKAIAAGKPAGTVGKPKGLKPGAIKAKPQVSSAAAPKPAATTPKQSSRRRRPTADQSRAAGLTPISDIRARQAAQSAARDASRTRRVQSNMSRARGQQVASTQGKQRAPFGRYSTIKNPAAEGSFPQMAPGRSGLGMAQAAKGRNQDVATKKPPMTKAEYEAAAQKAWGTAPRASTSKAKQSANQQLDRLSQRSGNLTRSKTGLSKAEVTKAQELAKKTGRSIRVSQNPSGGYSIKVANTL